MLAAGMGLVNSEHQTDSGCTVSGRNIGSGSGVSIDCFVDLRAFRELTDRIFRLLARVATGAGKLTMPLPRVAEHASTRRRLFPRVAEGAGKRRRVLPRVVLTHGKRRRGRRKSCGIAW